LYEAKLEVDDEQLGKAVSIPIFHRDTFLGMLSSSGRIYLIMLEVG
jgi:hypothetical protein